MNSEHGLIDVYLESSDWDESIGNVEEPFILIIKEKFLKW